MLGISYASCISSADFLILPSTHELYLDAPHGCQDRLYIVFIPICLPMRPYVLPYNEK